MNDNDTARHYRKLRALAIVNIAIWAIAMVVFVVLLQTEANIKGLYVILAAGIVIGIQFFPILVKLKASPE